MLQKEKIVFLKNVSINHDKHPVLQDINFDLVKAEFCYVVGKSGSGKSTLLKSLYAELPITKGIASVLGKDLITIKEKEIPLLRRKLGMVFQDFSLFENRSVQYNLDFVLRATDWSDKASIENRIREVLEKVNLVHKLDSKVYALSGGEKQRIAIARALLNNPKLLIADEPTGSLDSYTSDQILYLISDLATENKMSVIFATHDQRIIDKFPARKFECQQGLLNEIF